MHTAIVEFQYGEEREFFNDELVDRVTSLYGVRPTVSIVEVAELVQNA